MSHPTIEAEKTPAAPVPPATSKAKSNPRAKAAKRTKKAKRSTKPKLARKATRAASERSNKKAEVIALLQRSKGATLAEIMETTGWQAHTVRGFVSLLASKGGLTIESSKNNAGDRTYKTAK